MTAAQNEANIRNALDKFTEAVTGRNHEALAECFADDCEIEFLHVKLRGKQGARDWGKWLYGHLKEVQFDRSTSVVSDKTLMGEYVLHGRFHNGSRARSRQVQVLVFDDEYKIRNFRFYLDRLDFVESGINKIVARQLVRTFDQKTMLNLKSHG